MHDRPAHQSAAARGSDPTWFAAAAVRARSRRRRQPGAALVAVLDHELAAGGSREEFGALRIGSDRTDAVGATRLAWPFLRQVTGLLGRGRWSREIFGSNG